MTNALIEGRHLWKIYEVGDVQVEALRDVSLDIPAGQFVAIMGASGSGKSTLMNILGCLDRPTRGTYLLGGGAFAAVLPAWREGLKPGAALGQTEGRLALAYDTITSRLT